MRVYYIKYSHGYDLKYIVTKICNTLLYEQRSNVKRIIDGVILALNKGKEYDAVRKKFEKPKKRKIQSNSFE